MTFGELRERVKNAAQVRRLLAIAAVLDGAARQEAAKNGRHGSADAAGLGDPVQRAITPRRGRQRINPIPVKVDTDLLSLNQCRLDAGLTVD